MIALWWLCLQGQSTYSRQIKQVEDDIQQLLKKINELTGGRLNLLIVFIQSLKKVFPDMLVYLSLCDTLVVVMRYKKSQIWHRALLNEDIAV